MRIQLLSSLLLSLCISYLYRASSVSVNNHASLPPRGWNSYDSFGWTISEEEFLQSAEIISQRLKPFGYQYVVVDYLWYRKKVPGANADSVGFDVIDGWGRMVPDPARWPSSKGGKGFTQVATGVHSMGLKFGIHVMRGLSRQAYDANTLILDTTTGRAYEESGRQWRAKDIGIEERACAWMPHGFMSVNTSLGAGRAFLKSLYQQYAQWGLDFVKHDCVFGEDLDLNEIKFVSEVLKTLDRPILYSLSPGTSAKPALAKDISGLANMYRITGDDWDTWRDLASHFDVTRDFAAANMIGAEGLLGQSWPDLDMLPLGWLTDPASNEGPHRLSKLNPAEQRTQMTLWAMAKSPLIFGGDVRKLDNTTYSLITNPTILEINHFSSNNKEFPYVNGSNSTSSRKTEILPQQSRRNLTEVGTPQTQVLGLTSCSHPNVNGWSIEAINQDLEKICWKENLQSNKSLCLYKKKPPSASDEKLIHNQRKLHLFANDGMESCLDASPTKMRTSREHKRESFSPCRSDIANQKWELNSDGALSSGYSGLCATVTSVQANAGPSGVRSWIATGSRGEIYVALFNLNPEKTVISAKIADIAKVLPTKKLQGASCKCREVWTGKDFEVTKDSVSMEVEMHGVALFVLNCGTA